RPEGEGCYCKVNDLLREIIASLTLGFDFVVVDGEAGVEQINRRVLERVTYLVQVSDASARGIRVAETIGEVARQAVGCGAAGLVVNRIRGEGEMRRMNIPEGMNCLGWVPEDEAVRDADIRGESLLGLGDCAFFEAVARCMKKLGVV
ncbi:MAG: cobyrinic acid a,c-diamide synthase, partial [Myxococcota bacterium]